MLVADDNEITNRSEIANVLNMHFTSVGSKYISNMKQTRDQKTCTIIFDLPMIDSPISQLPSPLNPLPETLIVINQLNPMDNP